MANVMTMNNRTRAQLKGNVMERVSQLDDARLKELEAWLANPLLERQPEAKAIKGSGITRRQAIFGTLLGGAAVVSAGATGNVVGVQQTWAEANVQIAGQNATIDELRAQVEALEAGLEANRHLVGLYDQLDHVGLDNTVSDGMTAVVGSIGNTSQHAQRLRDGLLVAKENINQLDEGLAILDEGLVRVEGVITGLSQLMQGLEDRLLAAGEPVAPITDAFGSLFTGIISKIPFGIGERMQNSIEGIQSVIGAIPEGIESMNVYLIEPLRATFFPREGNNIQVRLLEPLTNVLFAPAEWTLNGLASLADTWEEQLEQPTQEKIQQRANLRHQIADYREKEEL